MWDNIEQDRHWLGEFIVNSEVMQGEILYNKKKGIILLKLEHTVDGFGKNYGDIPTITGKLTNGTIVTLINNRCVKNHNQNFQYVQIHFLAEYMIWAKQDAANKEFNSLTFIVENGLRWSELSQIKTKGIYDIQFISVEQKVFDWFGAKITFETHLENDLWTTPRLEKCNVVERLSISIVSPNKKPITYFINLRNKILSLISFAIKDNVNIEEQNLYNYDDFYLLANEKRYFKFNLTSNEVYSHCLNNILYDYNFTLSQLNNCQDLENKLEKLTPIFNLYLSLFKYENMPSEMIFLNIVQALETFHSRFFYNDKKSEYLRFVSNHYGTSQNFDIYKDLLMSNTQMDENCNYIILLSRLCDLLLRGNNGLFELFYIKNKDFAQKIVDTRHYYTHYAKNKENKALKNDELREAVYILSLLLEYHICLIMNIDIEPKIRTALQMYQYSKSKK